MNARNLGLVGLLAAVAAGCHSDPTNSLVGKPARVGFQFATVRLTVGDSLATYAILQDEGSNPINDPITITACDPTTATVSQVTSGAPLTQTNFYVKALKYGTACVTAMAQGLSDTMQVGAVPDHIVITAGPDSVVSGVSNGYTFSWRDKNNAVMAGVPAPSWAVASSAIGVFTDAVAGTYVGSDTGVTTITVGQSFSLLGGTVTTTVTSTPKTIVTVPATFDGTTNSPAPPGGNLIVSANPAGLQYTSKTTVWFGATAQTTGRAGVPTNVTVAVPDLAMWGSMTGFGLKGVGPNNATQVGASFTVQTPPVFSGTVGPSTNVFPADLLTLTKGASDSSFTDVAHAYFNQTRAWIIDTTATVAHIALPPAFKTGKQVLLLTGLGTNSVPTQDSLNSLDSTAYDQYDKVVGGAVQNSFTTGPMVTTDTVLYITLSGACPSGGPTVGGGAVTPDENCDDWIQVKNTKATDDSAVTLEVNWQTSADLGVTQDLDSYWISDTTGVADFSNFCVVDGCNGASSNLPERTTVVVPAGQTYYILINMFNIKARKYALAQITIGGL